MQTEDFNAIVERRLGKIRETLLAKGKEYSGEAGDSLHSFKKGQKMTGCDITPAQILKGFKLKHDISVDDMIEGQSKVTPDLIDEKIGDVICYNLLLEAIFWESIGEMPKDKEKCKHEHLIKYPLAHDRNIIVTECTDCEQIIQTEIVG